MNKFERARIEIKEEDLTTNFGRFLIEPLERGFATTLGNAIRRVMISSLPGAAVYSVKIDNVFHEFTTVKGVKEDVTMIILNLKSLILKINDDEPHALRIDAFGPKVVTAADIELPAGVECLNPELVICTLEEDSEIHMEMMAKIGRGYVSNEENKRIYQATSQGIGTIYTDSIYTPVVKANFQAEPTRVGESTKYDRLILEVRFRRILAYALNAVFACVEGGVDFAADGDGFAVRRIQPEGEAGRCCFDNVFTHNSPSFRQII